VAVDLVGESPIPEPSTAPPGSGNGGENGHEAVACACQDIAVGYNGYAWGYTPDYRILGGLGLKWSLLCSPGELAQGCRGWVETRPRTASRTLVQPSAQAGPRRGRTSGQYFFMYWLDGEPPGDRVEFDLIKWCDGRDTSIGTDRVVIYLSERGGFKMVDRVDVGDATAWRRRR